MPVFISCSCNFIITFCTELASLTVALFCLHVMNQSLPAIKSIYNCSANTYIPDFDHLIKSNVLVYMSLFMW